MNTMRDPAGRVSAEVVRFPGPGFAFDACEIDAQFITRYDAERSMMIVVEGILRKNSEQLKASVQAVVSEAGVSLVELAADINSAANGFRCLSELFKSAAARIEAVEAKLV